MTPDEAVEAAAVGIWEARPMQRSEDGAPLPFSEAKPYLVDRYRTLARAALDAAAPFLVAEAKAGAYEDAAENCGDSRTAAWIRFHAAGVRRRTC